MADVRHGICILPEHPWAQAAPLWREADELGFDHGWTYDHLVWAGLPDAPWHSTVATLALAVTVTMRMRLGTFVASPNFRHPALLMRDVLTLDDASGGRLLLGLGAGGDLDSQVLGIDLTRGERTRRFRELVELLDRLLTSDHVTHDGEFFTTRDLRTLPGCVQQPRVPFVIAANGPKGQALAARLGQGWVTTGRQGPSHLDDSTPSEAAWWRSIAELAAHMGEALDDAGRADDASFRRYLSLDSAGVPALTSAARYADLVGRAGELGFTDVICHWPRPTEPYRATRAVLEEVAADHLTPATR